MTLIAKTDFVLNFELDVLGHGGLGPVTLDLIRSVAILFDRVRRFFARFTCYLSSASQEFVLLRLGWPQVAE